MTQIKNKENFPKKYVLHFNKILSNPEPIAFSLY